MTSPAVERQATRADRRILLVAYALLLVALSAPALAALAQSGYWQDATVWRATVLVVGPAVVIALSAIASRFNLAWCVFWTWAYIFLGLAPAYQLSINRLPWGAPLDEGVVTTAQSLLLLSYVIALVAYFLARPRMVRDAPAVDLSARPRARRLLLAMMWVHVLIVVAFVALMGTAMILGRAAFSQKLVSLSDIPGFGTIYFLSTAGAIILPAIAIIARKRGMTIPAAVIGLSVMASFIATNPLIGSRFLTGSFLIAVTAAALSDYFRRWLPAGVIVLFVTVFPTLDVARGDGTGANAVAIADPATSLVALDFDAFEMLYRALLIHGQELPNTAPTSSDLLIAPFLRWLPFLSNSVQGDVSGPMVAEATGMNWTNVSMPLWGEALVIGSWFGVVVTFAILGVILSRFRSPSSLMGQLVTVPIAALFFIVLRGSLYEVLGYLLLALLIGWWLSRVAARDVLARPASLRESRRRRAQLLRRS